MENTEKVGTKPPYGIIAVLMIGAFIAFLNNTLLNVALPSIMREFQIDTATVQWMTTGYMLINGILIPTTAFLIEKYSIRRLFLSAMSLFTLGTAIAAFSPIFSVLIGARMVQATGSAIMIPLLMNVMLISFPIEKRGRAMGVFGLILMFAPAIGPTLSGWIVEHFQWRALFYMVFPIALTILITGFFLLKDKKGKVDIHLDKISLMLSTFGFGGLLYGFSFVSKKGWDDPFVYGTIMIGILALILFVGRQSKMERPMLNFRVFKYPMFSLASVITIIVNVAMFSGIMLLPIYMQELRGFSPMESGLMLLPGAITNALMSPITGRLFDKYGGKILAIIGLTILAFSTFMFSHLTFETGFIQLALIHAVRMFGLSMVMMPVSTNGLNQLPRRLYPHGTAMNNTLNQVSAAIGTAMIISFMSIRQQSYFGRFKAEAIKEGINESDLGNMIVEFQKTGMLEGINDAFLLSAIIAVVGLILSFFIKRGIPAEEDGLGLKKETT